MVVVGLNHQNDAYCYLKYKNEDTDGYKEPSDILGNAVFFASN